MDRQERAQLLLQLEETDAQLRELRSALQRAGSILGALGSMLAEAPENTAFANAPPPLGHMPLHLMHTKVFDWNSIPDKVVLAQKIQDLRGLHERLQQLERRLAH